jgi:hypothetical protein
MPAVLDISYYNLRVYTEPEPIGGHRGCVMMAGKIAAGLNAWRRS